MGPKTYDLFREHGKFTVKEITAYIKVYIDTDNKSKEQKYDMLATCILTYISPGTRSKLHAIYDNFKIGGMVYGELVFKGLMKKAVVVNKQTTQYLQDKYDNIPLYMTTCDSYIAKFILEWRNLMRLLEACGAVLTDKFKIMWRDF